MIAPAGWYADPWGYAELRWWTGAQWTGWTHPPILQPQAAQPDSRLVETTIEVVESIPSAATAPTVVDVHAAPGGGLASLLAGVDRVAVIDVETTGLYRADRVVEIAIVTMDADGTVIDEFDTLVNPFRDPGPTWIHGVTGSMLVDAPAFDDIADHVAARLHGAVVVAHNLRFDTRMIGHEFGRAGIDIDWGSGLDTLHATGCKLGVACVEYGIPLAGAHRALNDARATGRLLFAVSDAFTGTCLPVGASPLRRAPARRVLTRDGFADAAFDVPYLAELARGVHADTEVAAYVTVLDRAVADLQLTSTERRELTVLADELGLHDRRRERAHHEFLNGLIDAALEDSIVSDAELDQLCRVAALLDLDAKLVTRRTNPYRLTEDTITLDTGLQVCFTGAALDEHGNPIDRATVLEAQAREHGLVPKDSLTKSCGLLIVADTASQSTKVATARRYGTPVAALADYRRALTTGDPLTVTRLSTTGVGQVCGECGDSWVAARRATNPVCPGCRGTARSTAATVKRGALKGNAAAAPPAVETLVCTVCLGTWERPRTRGRRPTRCPDCIGDRVEVPA